MGDLSGHLLAGERGSAPSPLVIERTGLARHGLQRCSVLSLWRGAGGPAQSLVACVWWVGPRWALGRSLCGCCCLRSLTLCCVQDNAMVLGLIETVDTVMGHISSNLDTSKPQVAIIGSSSMAGTGQLGVGCSRGCRWGAGDSGGQLACGACSDGPALTCTSRCVHVCSGPRTHLHRCAHTRAQVRTPQRTHLHTQGVNTRTKVRTRAGVHTHTHRCTHTRSSKHTISSDRPLCFSKLCCPYAILHCGGRVRSGHLCSAVMWTQSCGSV